MGAGSTLFHVAWQVHGARERGLGQNCSSPRAASIFILVRFPRSEFPRARRAARTGLLFKAAHARPAEAQGALVHVRIAFTQAVWMGQNYLPTQRGRQPCPLLVPAQLLARPVGSGAVSVRLSESLWVVAQGLQEGLLLEHVLQEARRPRDELSGCEPWCRLRPGPVLCGPLSPRPGSVW